MSGQYRDFSSLQAQEAMQVADCKGKNAAAHQMWSSFDQCEMYICANCRKSLFTLRRNMTPKLKFTELSVVSEPCLAFGGQVRLGYSMLLRAVPPVLWDLVPRIWSAKMRIDCHVE
jgi:hypothetical protein